MNKVTLTTEDIKHRLDKLKLLLGRRHKLFENEVAQDREQYYREKAKVQCVLDYVKTDEWCEWLWVAEVVVYSSRKEVILAIENKLYQDTGVSEDIPILTQEDFNTDYDTGVHTCIIITPDYKVVPFIEQRNIREVKSLPIEELKYLVSLDKDVEVDVDWLRKIDEIEE